MSQDQESIRKASLRETIRDQTEYLPSENQ